MKHRNGNRRLGALLISLGAFGSLAALAALITYDFHSAFRTWLVETMALSQRLLATPGLVTEAQLMVMALVTLAGGAALFTAGAVLLVYEAGQRPSRQCSTAPAEAHSAEAL